MRVGEPARDRGARQVDHRVDPGERIRIGIGRVPLPLVRVSRGMTHQPDDPMSAGAEKCAQRRPDEARRSRDRHRCRPQPVLGCLRVRGEVIGQLAVPIGEHRAQCQRGHRCLNPVDHPGAVLADIFEFVDMPPAHRNPRRQRSQSGGADGVDETPRRIVAVRLVLGHPAKPPGQRELAPARSAASQLR